MTKQRKARIRGLIILLIGIAALAAGLMILYQNERGEYQETRGRMSEGFGSLKTIQWQGKTYREKPAITTILVAGVDRDGTITESSTSFRNGGQADFLMLLAVDHTEPPSD